MRVSCRGRKGNADFHCGLCVDLQGFFEHVRVAVVAEMQKPMQVGSGYLQGLGGNGLVPAGLFHGFKSKFVFEVTNTLLERSDWRNLFLGLRNRALKQTQDVFCLDATAVAENQCVLNHIFKFTHVARPVVGLQNGQGSRVESFFWNAVLGSVRFQKISG